MAYFIAYKDVNGNDFDGQPWVIPEGGFDDIKMTIVIKDDFIRRGFKDVKIFESINLPDVIDWEYVESNEI
jgi:hypothetical protein